MKSYKLIIMLLFASLLGVSQNITRMEYFVDNDPGYGNGISIPFSGSEIAEADFTVPLNSLGNGIHFLYLRAQNQDGDWSVTSVHHILKDVFQGEDAVIDHAEYYIDNDPGFGNGTPISVSSGKVVDVAFNLDVSGLDNGLHLLNLRTRTDDGAWSLTHTHHILRDVFQSSDGLISGVEYFFGADPGLGNGTSVSVSPAKVADVAFQADLSALSPGLHFLHTRAKTDDNTWGALHNHPVFVDVFGTEDSEITQFEYFIDIDPGIGNATSVEILPGKVVDVAFDLDVSSLDQGFHFISVRSASENNIWSHAYTSMFLMDVLDSGESPITKVEYFIDDDPGIGNATDVSITPGKVVEIAFDVDVSSLGSGFHFISVRSASENDVWSHAYTSMFLMDVLDSGESPITKVEYFVDEDPGIGNATDVSITPGKVVEIAFDVDVSGLESGFHFVSVRSASEDDVWSHAYTSMFLMDVLDTGEEPIVEVEYFIDDDPGIGNATQVSITPGKVVDLSFEIDLNGLEPGFHFVTVRSKSDADVWSMGYFQMFYLDHISSLSEPDLVAVEYFLDEDPGFGNGTSRNINPPAPVADKEMIVSFGSVGPGEHILYMRAIDEFDNWSIVAYDTVMVEQGNYYALRFDGEDDYLEAGEVPFPEDDLTIEAWINPTEMSGYQEIVYWYGDAAGVQFRLNADGSLLYGESSNGFSYVTSEPGIIPTNKWTHIALTKEGDLCNLFANGIHIGFSQFDNNPVCHTLQIGGRGNNMDRFFNGDIDEVRIWNVALTPEDIMDNFCTYFEGDEEGLFGLWHCNEGPGSSVAYDFGPNGFGAWLNNMEVNAGPDCAWVDHPCELPPANDLAITSFASPEDLILASESSIMEVTVNVRNFGIETWDGNVALSYQMDGGGTISENTYLFMNPGDVEQFTFGTSVDLSLPGTYQLTAGLTASGDEYLNNNTLTRSINSVEISRSVYAYNGYPNQSGLPEGPIVFDLENPETVFSLADQSNEHYFNGGTWMDGQWWAIANDTLYTVDTLTGNRTFVGVPGNFIAALAYDPLGEKLYGLSWVSLEEIDPVTGNSTYIGYSGIEGFAAMTSDADGNLFALNVNDDQIYQLDKETGLATAIGYIGFDANYEQDMDFDPITGNIYLTAYNVDVNQGELRTVDPLTGNTTYLGTFRGGMEITGFAIPYDPPQAPGEFALRFDGEDDYLEAGEVSYPEDDLTIEAWINPTELTDIQEIIYWHGDDVSVQLRLHDDGSLLFGEWADGNWGYVTTGPGFIQPMQWTHVALSKEGDLCNLYINGIHAAFNQFDNNPVTHTLQIGGRGFNMDRFFNGDIDEVRIWNVARTREDIMDNFCANLVGNEEGIYGLWHFNEGPGSATAYDSGPNGFGAWLQNMQYDSGPDCSWIDHSCVLPPAVNIAVTAIVAPEELLLASASAAVEIKVQVRNFGTETYNGDATIAYQLIGADVVSEITSLNLAPGAFVDYTFSTPADFSIPDWYELKAFVTVVGDVNPENDSLSKDINSVEIERSVYAYNAYPNQSGLPKGPIVFDLENPEHLFSLADQSNENYLKGGTWMNEKWWAIANDTLYTIDTIAGNRTFVGVPGSYISSLAYDPVGEKLYGQSWVSLYEIDPLSGNSSYKGYSGTEGFHALACNAEGNLYALNVEDDQLYQIDKVDGEATAIGPIGFDARYDQDMDFDPITGNIYLTAYNDGVGQGELRTVDPLTGNTTYLGTFRGGMEVCGFAIPPTTEPPVTDNNALHFDGIDDYVEVPDLVCPNQFTIECWVNYQGLVSYTYNTLVEFNNDNPWLGINQGRATIYQVVSSDEEIGEGWHHLAFVVGEDYSQIFVDGQEAGYAGWRPSISTVPGMGIGYHVGDSYWHGSMDELRIWDYARNEAEVDATMNQELSGDESGLVAYYNFNQGVAGGNNTGITTLYNTAESKAYNGTLNDFTLTGNTSNFIQAGWQNNGLVANFYATPDFGKVPLDVAFTDISTGDIESWSWDFGDGNTSSDQHPEHTYTESGFYTVSLSVTDASGSDTETKESYIEVEPLTIYDLQFTAIPGPDNTYPSLYADMTVSVSGYVYAANVNGTASAFFITTPEGGPWNGIFVYNADIEPALGDEVELTGLVKEYSGLTEIHSPEGTILSSGNSLPSVQIIATVDLQTPAIAEPYESCLVQVQNVTVIQIANEYGQWYVDDLSGNCEIDDRMFAYEPYLGENLGFVRGPVYYGFGYYAINPRVADDIQNNVFAAEFTSNTTTGIVPLSIEFTDLSTGDPDSWLWEFGDDETSTLQNPSHLYTNPGFYTVSLTVSDGSTSDDITKVNYIHVNSPATGNWLAEYFFDIDPGYGNAIPIYGIGDTDVLFTFNAPVNHLSDGLHTFYSRSKNENGAWSQTMARSFIKQVLPGDSDPNISYLEYFFDVDPGFGQATPIAVDALSPMEVAINLPLESLPFGLHNLYVRSQDQNGKWGIVMQRAFIMGNYPADPLPQLVKAEYFIDEDPGQGLAEPVLFDLNNGIHEQEFDANLEGYEWGEHMLYVRTMDESGSWSITVAEPFNVAEPPIIAEFSADITAGSVPLMVQFTDETYVSSPTEWLWDFGDGNTSIEQNPEHVFANPGEFTVSLTATGPEGSDTKIKENYITVFPPIYSLEYFFDEDPGYGNGNGVYTYSSNVGGFDFLIPLDDLDEGYHLLFVRVQDSSDVWTQTMSRSFLKTRLLSDPDPNIVQVEYFIDEDPGYGLGDQLAVNTVATPVVDALISLDEYDDGLHNIYVRSKDANGKWSETMARPFLKSYVPNDVVNVAGLEYFIDADPGVGNGTPVSIPNPSATVERNFVVNLGSQTPGEHRLFVRAIDDRGSWGIVYNQLIEVTATGAVHVLQLPEGWSGISSFVIPDVPAVETTFEPVVDELVILQNFDGMYWPFAGVNTIGNWSDMDGYQVKMETAQQVTFTGDMQQNLTVNLEDGWNYLPVLNACDNMSEDLFAEIQGSLQIVKEIAGPNVYWPQFGINTLNLIKPGKAYFALVDEDVEVEFPECTPIPAFPLEGEGDGQRGGSPSPEREGWGEVSQWVGTPLLLQEKGAGDEVSPRAGTPSPQGEGWGEVFLAEVKTPITHTIAIPSEAISGLSEDDIIVVYGANGQCYGAVPYQNHNLALTAYGDDPTTTQIDGFSEGETMQFRVYNPETAREYPLEVEFDVQMPQVGYFVNHGLSAIKSIQVTGIGGASKIETSVNIYPNPSTGIFNVRHADLTGFQNLSGLDADWEVTNTHGSIIATGDERDKDFSINLTSYPKGIYYLKISQGGTQVVRKLVLQ